jgi:CPA2 family monovalent cation:H+ antiporter-2
MPHDTPLIATIVAGLVLAFIFGAIANRLRFPPLVGYLIAGIAVGPYTPGFVANGEIASELSEIGVILLMFGVGLNFSLDDLLHVQAVAVPGALLRIVGGTALGVGLALLMGWGWGAGLIFGLALSVASTVVLLKTLQDRHLMDSDRGRIAVGWVIVEDMAMVIALVLIPAFATLLGGTAVEQSDPFVDVIERFANIDLNIWAIVGVTVVKLAAFVGFMLVVGRRIIPSILHFTAHTGSRELFRLAVLAIALGVAAGAAYLFGVSLALGAFFAGMILSESQLSQRAAQESLPLRDAFAVLFFVSVGMLFDPLTLINHPLEVLATLLIILVGKSALGFVLLVALRRTVPAALTISASLAQIGEFSFILATLGIGLGIMPPEGQSLILAGSILSIILNPLMFYIAEHIRPRFESRIPAEAAPAAASERIEPALTPASAPAPAAAEARPVADAAEHQPTALTGHAVLVGYGRVGGVIAGGLKAAGVPFVLIEDAERRVAAAHAAGIEVIDGNGASTESLALANITGARAVLVAIPNAFEAGQAVEQARHLNPDATIIARAHADEEIAYLQNLGANHVIMGEREIGLGMLSHVAGAASSAATSLAMSGLAAVASALKLEGEPKNVVLEALEVPPAAAAPAESAVPGSTLAETGTELVSPASGTPEAASEPDAAPPPASAESRETATIGAEASADDAFPAPPAEVPVEMYEPPPLRKRPNKPATAPASPFNPEVPPEEVEG